MTRALAQYAAQPQEDEHREAEKNDRIDVHVASVRLSIADPVLPDPL